ncbi:MAG: hypothetical protein ACKN9Y_07535 [Bacteroidota bacterium]
MNIIRLVHTILVMFLLQQNLLISDDFSLGIRFQQSIGMYNENGISIE